MKCRECKYIETRGANRYCTYHDAYVGWHGCEYGESKPQTNADRIRAMTDDEELANTLHFMFVAYDFRDPLDILGWLQSPVEEDEA